MVLQGKDQRLTAPQHTLPRTAKETLMTNDDFTKAARAEAPPECDHYWVSHSQNSELIPWVIRCGLCGDFNTAEMDRVARTHLADLLASNGVRAKGGE